MDRAAFDDKAPQCGAFLLWLCCALGLAFLPPPSVAGICSVPKDAELAAVRQVIDGDTLQLRDGRHIRLIGLDTPEIGHDGERDMPGAQAAKSALQQLVHAGGDRVYLQPGRESRDRYRRWLAHLYTPDGKSLTQALLRKGLGRQIAFPPNLSNLECYRDAEASARAEKRGLWQTAVQEAASLQGDESGFHLLRGRIAHVGRSRSALWLDLEGGLAIRIAWKDWDAYFRSEAEPQVGRRLEFRGWIYRQKGEQRVRVRHPSAMRWL